MYLKNISFSPFQPNSRTGPFPFSSSRPRPAAGGPAAYFPSSPFFLPPAPACWLWPAAPFPLMHRTRTVGTTWPSSSHGLLCAARSGLLHVSPERSPAARVTSPSRCKPAHTSVPHLPFLSPSRSFLSCFRQWRTPKTAKHGKLPPPLRMQGKCPNHRAPFPFHPPRLHPYKTRVGRPPSSLSLFAVPVTTAAGELPLPRLEPRRRRDPELRLVSPRP